MQLDPTPIRLGVFYDFPQGDGGALAERALRLGIDDATARRPIGRPVEFVGVHARGLPIGSEHELIQAFDELAESGVLAIVGPSISDNCLIARDRADEHRVPTINYSGGERTRSTWMFHYQIGSLEEEPFVIADRLGVRRFARVAVVFDRSPVGSRYLARFESAAADRGIEVAMTSAVDALTEDLTATVGALRATEPTALVYLGLGVAARAVALALLELSWDVPVLANSALMFGYARPEWRSAWEGWEYIDQVADDNPVRLGLAERDRAIAGGPVGCGLYDIGRLIGSALAGCEHLTRAGVADALRNVKRLAAACGHPGTTMGFGVLDHGALKGDFLVIRRWEDGRTIPVD